MVDPLSFLIIYAILTVVSSISSNVASSGIFRLLEPRIFKTKDLQEIKDALQDVIDHLEKQGYKQESDELHSKISETSEATMKLYKNWQDDPSKAINDLFLLINQKLDVNSKEIEELKRLVLEYDLRKPYDIFARDSEEFVVLLHPPFEIEPVERSELDELITGQNIIIIGKPGIGKTLLLRQIAERQDIEKIIWIKGYFSEIDVNRLMREPLPERVLLVWDDIQNNAEVFYQTMGKLKDIVENLRIIGAVRSTEIEKIRKIPKVFLEECRFLEKEIPVLDLGQRRELIRRCSEKTGIEITEDVMNELAGKSDGTPLYIISVFLEEKYKTAGRILMGDIKTLPADVVNIWGRYFEELDSSEKAVLRYLMILSKVGVEGFKPLVEGLFMFGGDTYSILCDALDGLREKLWLVDTRYTYECHDVQLEAIPFEDGILIYLKKFALAGKQNVYTRFLLYFGISKFHSEEVVRSQDYRQSMFHVNEAVQFVEKSLSICRELGLRSELAMSLNNASSIYSSLSSLQEKGEERTKSLETALEYIKEAIDIKRELGLRSELAMSLNNASNIYSDLSSYQTGEERVNSLKTSLEYIEEAINIYRDLGLRSELAMSLSNASNRYSNLSSYQTGEERVNSLKTSLEYIKEAINIYRELGLRSELAMSLSNASNRYSNLSYYQTGEERVNSLRTSLEYIEEAIKICRDLGLKFELSGALNNASNRYSNLSFFQTGEEKKRSLENALEYIKEAIDTRNELGLKDELAMSLNVASNIYSNLSLLQQTREEKVKSLETSLEYSEEAIKISRMLGLRSELSMSLNNASCGYLDLSYLLNEEEEEEAKNLQIALEYIKEAIDIRRELGLRFELSESLSSVSRIYLQLSTRKGEQEQRSIFNLAVSSIEKAIEIRKDLGFILELADSLAISVLIYDSFLRFNSQLFSKAMRNCDEAINVFLKFHLKGRYCHLLPLGTKYHQTMYTLDNSLEHLALIKRYQHLLTRCSA